MNINIYVYVNANQLVKKGFELKCGISKLVLRGTQTRAISPSAKEYYNITEMGRLLVHGWNN